MRRNSEMDVDRLVKILDDLPDGSTVQPNTVGNLVVNDADYEMLGYIDFAAGYFVPVD